MMRHGAFSAVVAALSGSAVFAAVLVGFQNGPVDSAAIYDARCGVGNYSPLFNPLTYKPHKAYCAFLAFNELRKAVLCRITDATRSFEEVELPSVMPPTSFVVTELAY